MKITIVGNELKGEHYHRKYSQDVDWYINVCNQFLFDKIQQQRTAKGSKITPTTRYNKRSKRTQQQPENKQNYINIFRNPKLITRHINSLKLPQEFVRVLVQMETNFRFSNEEITIVSSDWSLPSAKIKNQAATNQGQKTDLSL